MAALTLFPLQYQRQDSAPIDIDSVFTTTAARLAYLTSPRRYAGQIVSDIELGEAFVLDATKTAWIPIGTGSSAPGAVESVNGQTGNVVLTTDTVGEGTANLYFTQQRVIDAFANIPLKTLVDVDDALTPTAGDLLVYDGTIWTALPISALGAGVVTSVAGRTGAVFLTTDDVAEGTKLYYTTARFTIDYNNAIADTSISRLVDVDSALSPAVQQVLMWDGQKWTAGTLPGAPVLTVNGQIGDVVLTTTDIGEGTNQYFTDSRFAAALEAAFPLAFKTEFEASSIGDLADVDLTGAAANSVLLFNGAKWISQDLAELSFDAQIQAALAALKFTQLADVTISNPQNGDFVRWKDGAWVAETIDIAAVLSVNGKTGDVQLSTSDIPEGSNEYWTNDKFDARFSTKYGEAIATLGLSNLVDVSVAGAVDQDVLAFSAATNKWSPVVIPSAPVLSVNGYQHDVVLTTSDIAEGSNYYWTQARFNTAIADVPLTTLADVTLSAPAAGEYLVYNGSAWVNSDITQGAAGQNQQIQWNSNGVFAASPSFTWYNSSGILTVNSLIIDTASISTDLRYRPDNTTVIDGSGQTIMISTASVMYRSQSAALIVSPTGSTLRASENFAGAVGPGNSVNLIATAALSSSEQESFNGGSVIATVGRSSGPAGVSGAFVVKSTDGVGRLRINADAGDWAVSGDYGSSLKVLTSNGQDSAVTWAYPFGVSDVGAAGQVLTSNGPGNQVIWSNPVPAAAGIDTQIQFNKNNVVSGSAALTWDDSTRTLGLGNGFPVTIKQKDGGLGQSSITLQGGAGGVYEGGTIYLIGGAASTTGSGTQAGGVQISGGNSSTAAAAGDITVAAGSTSTSGAGGDISISAGASGTGAGGSLTLSSGAGATPGFVAITSASYIQLKTNSTTSVAAFNSDGSWSIGDSTTNVGSANQVLTSSGAGAAPQWKSISDFAAAGAAGAIQFASSTGGLVGISSFTFDQANNNLDLGAAGSPFTIQAIGTSLTVKAGASNALYLTGGSSSGSVIISGGASTADASAGGSITIKAADFHTNASDGYGGSITITAGAGNGTGTNGDLTLGTVGSGNGGNFVVKTVGVERLRILKSGAWSVGSAGTNYGTSGQILTSNGSSSAPTWSAQPYDIAVSIADKPAINTAVLNFVVTRAFTWPANLTGSLFKAATAATASTTFSILNNANLIGSIVFAANSTTGAATFAAATTFAVGDLIQVVAPAAQDSTLANISFVFLGTLV